MDVEREEAGEVDARSDEEIEAAARQAGWHPEEEYNGPEGKFVDAREFVRKGENALPILRQRYRQLSERSTRSDQKIAGLENTLAEQKAALAAALDLAKRADERGYQRGLSELKDKAREAVESGDTAAYDQTQEQIKAMEAERAKTPDPAPTPAATAKVILDPPYQAFVDANPWMNTDEALRNGMINRHRTVLGDSPGMDIAESLDLAKKRLMKAFPEKFGRGAREEDDDGDDEDDPPARPARAAPVSRPSGGGAPQRRPAATGIDSIPDAAERARARTAFRKIADATPGYTEADYMEVYDNPHVDVLAQLNRKK